MPADKYTRIVLTLIALFLGVIALRPLWRPAPVFAGVSASELYIEPGVYTLRAPDGSKELLGKVAIDLRNGKIWGFPTYNKTPYPITPARSEPPVSTPYLLGTFDLAALDK